MTTMTTTDAPFSTGAQAMPEALRALIDARLDTIERMLLGRVARPDRLAIVRDVEGQIHEMIAGRCEGDSAPDRDDVLAVLADLDPPEAYLPEEGEGAHPGQGRLRVRLVAPPREPAAPGPQARAAVNPRFGLWSGILGLVALGMVFAVPLVYLIAVIMESEFILFVVGALVLGIMLIVSVVAIVLAFVARLRDSWAIVGLVAGLLGLFVGLGGSVGCLLMMMMGG
jgi:hypothetical protein